MYYLNVFLTVPDDARVADVAKALARCGAESRLEPGCERWEAYQSDADPKKFLLVERWTTKADWEAHRNGKAVQEIYLKEVIPHVVREPHPSRLID